MGINVGANHPPPLHLKILAGLVTGLVGIAAASPTDLVKIRLQAERTRGLTGEPPRYRGTWDAFRKIYKYEGIRGFWSGVVPNMVRNSVINACELATYDQIKQTVLEYNLLQDGVGCHIASASGAGFTAAFVGSPVDVLKTRLMNQSNNMKQYNGVIHAFVTILRTEGFTAFYKGFTANASRIMSWNIVMFMAFEQIKRFAKNI
uniref:Mitochondrial uncoupling protein 3 n=1 Tax=Lygus hesperus TaxID=30085 RepID=A0A0A9YYM4_LYGHE